MTAITESIQGIVTGYARDYMADCTAIVVRVAPGLVVWVPMVEGLQVVQVKPIGAPRRGSP